MNTRDRMGACVICHKDMIIERVVDNKIVKMFSPDQSSARFLLKDGSVMPVCVCRQCKERVNLDDPILQCDIMKSVIEGWQWETDTLVANQKRLDWTPEKAVAYMQEYGKHEIHCHQKDA